MVAWRQVECPVCKTVVHTPTKKHYYSEHRGEMYYQRNRPGTLCGKDHKNMRLIAKEGEEVTCKVCLKRYAKGIR